MTTIYWDPRSKTLFADSRNCRRTEIAGFKHRRIADDKQKIVTFRPDDCARWGRNERILAFAGAGDVSGVEFLGMYVIQHGGQVCEAIREIPHLPQLVKPTILARLLIITERQIIRLAFRKGVVKRTQWPIDSAPPLAIGSGARAVLIAAETFGLDGADAMRFARFADAGSGGAIEHYRLHSTGELERQEPIAFENDCVDFNKVRQAMIDLPERNPVICDPLYYAANAAYAGAAQQCLAVTD